MKTRTDEDEQGEQTTNAPEAKRTRRAGNRGTGEIFRRGRFWWISYHVSGKRFRESAKSDVRKDAVRLLRLRTGWVAQGHQPMPDVGKTTFADLAAMLIDDYEANGKRSLRRVRGAVAHLTAFFGHWHANDHQRQDHELRPRTPESGRSKSHHQPRASRAEKDV